jgi:hypothetical protein
LFNDGVRGCGSKRRREERGKRRFYLFQLLEHRELMETEDRHFHAKLKKKKGNFIS